MKIVNTSLCSSLASPGPASRLHFFIMTSLGWQEGPNDIIKKMEARSGSRRHETIFVDESDIFNQFCELIFAHSIISYYAFSPRIGVLDILLFHLTFVLDVDYLSFQQVMYKKDSKSDVCMLDCS